jgi:hypothetical protein
LITTAGDRLSDRASPGSVSPRARISIRAASA